MAMVDGIGIHICSAVGSICCWGPTNERGVTAGVDDTPYLPLKTIPTMRTKIQMILGSEGPFAG